MTARRWYAANSIVAVAAYGLAMLLLALTAQLTATNALLSIAPVVLIFGVMAWVQRPKEGRSR